MRKAQAEWFDPSEASILFVLFRLLHTAFAECPVAAAAASTPNIRTAPVGMV
jgi:hypothetical protein